MLAAAKTLATDSNGNTALHRCTTPKEVEALVALGLNVNAKNDEDINPLHSACSNDRLEAAQMLIAVGTDVNAKSTDDWTPLHSVCIHGHLETAQTLIAAGADVNARGGGGWAPLHYACNSGNPKLAQTLIAAGADLNVKTDAGNIPLDLCKTDEMRALLFARKVERIPKDLLAALKDLLAQYE